MICPKCAFNQPDDIYCALCGVHIEKYLRRTKRRRIKIGLAVLFFCVVVVAAASFFSSSRPPAMDSFSQQETGTVLAPVSRKADRDRVGRQRTDESPGQAPLPLGDRKESRVADLREPASEKEKERPPEQGEDAALTAKEWFDKGIRLDDDSEAEVEFYRKALETDATFAPASFRLGAIYYRQANYELADEEFTNFLRHATDEDRDAYDIYVYYSTADVERLIDVLTKEEAAEEEGKETPAEPEKESGQEPSAEEGPKTEEVLTIVPFSPANGQIVVSVMLNGSVGASVLVDTGAGITVLSKELADNLDLNVEGGRRITLKTMSRDVQAHLATVESIQVGRVRRDRFTVAVADLPMEQDSKFDAILGMDFLQNYAILIDNQKNTLALAPRSR